jgi:DNA-binding FrmR family transcriptional regulator
VEGAGGVEERFERFERFMPEEGEVMLDVAVQIQSWRQHSHKSRRTIFTVHMFHDLKFSHASHAPLELKLDELASTVIRID